LITVRYDGDAVRGCAGLIPNQRPNDLRSLDARGSIFEASGRREEAIADFRRAQAKDETLQNSKDALKRLGASS
jgi:hypothetical protein